MIIHYIYNIYSLILIAVFTYHSFPIFSPTYHISIFSTVPAGNPTSRYSYITVCKILLPHRVYAADYIVVWTILCVSHLIVHADLNLPVLTINWLWLAVCLPCGRKGGSIPSSYTKGGAKGDTEGTARSVSGGQRGTWGSCIKITIRLTCSEWYCSFNSHQFTTTNVNLQEDL